MKVTKTWVVVLLLLGCNSTTRDSKSTQVEAATVAQEKVCDKLVARFKAGEGEGLTCQASKERAERENPQCTLQFECGRRNDAGLEGGTP